MGSVDGKASGPTSVREVGTGRDSLREVGDGVGLAGG
jgi:hypothetical protein